MLLIVIPFCFFVCLIQTRITHVGLNQFGVNQVKILGFCYAYLVSLICLILRIGDQGLQIPNNKISI